VLRTLLFLAGFAAVAAGPLPSRAADGSGLFTQNCLMCHQAGAVGLPGQFPRLAGDDQSIVGLMPPFAQLSNDDVAGVLSYVQSLGDPPAGTPAAFTAEEVRAGRTNTAKSPTDVRAERQSLEDAKIIP
jgi:mono/diheme cytochrome c family protein